MQKEMYSRVKPLSDNKLLCLSSNRYYLNLIMGEQLKYRIDTQDPIVYFSPLSSSLFLSQPTQNVNLFIVINRRLQWEIFTIVDNESPCSLFYGYLQGLNQHNTVQYHNMQQSVYNNKSSNISVVNVHETQSRVVIILSNLQVHELIVNAKDNQGLVSYIRKKSIQSPIRINSQIIYPHNQSQSAYLTHFYLPSLQTNTLIDSLFIPLIQSFNNLQMKSIPIQKSISNSNQQPSYLLYLVFQSNTKTVNKNTKYNNCQLKSYTIYQCIFHPKQKILLSGNQSALNITDTYLGIYSLKQKDSHMKGQTKGNQIITQSEKYNILVQTEKQIYLWQSNTQKQIQSINYLKYQFTNPFTPSNNKQSLLSIAKQNTNNQSVKFKLIALSFKKDKGLVFQQLNHIENSKEEPLLFLQNSTDIKESYIFYSDYSIKKMKATLQNNLSAPIFADHSVTVEKTQFVSVEPCTNILFVSKKSTFSQNSLIITNSFIQTNRVQYQHNLPLQLAKVVHTSSNNSNQNSIIISSPLIGTLSLNVSKTNSNDVNIKVIQNFKQLSGYQSLAVSSSLKSFINEHQIVFDIEANKLGKLPSLTVSKLFDSSTDFVEKGVILQKSGFYLLSLQDQLHVFEGNNEKSLKRKFIHCFRSHIKEIFKLNDVNVIGVELYQSHSQNLTNQNEGDSDDYQPSMCVLEVYVIKQDRLILVNKVKYGNGVVNCNPLSFLTHINTVPHWFTCIYDKVLLVSSQQTHRYNPEKVKVQTYDFPSPLPQYTKLTVVPLINLSSENKINPENQFLLLLQQRNSSSYKMFVASFLKKLLIKNMEEIKVSYESVISSLDLIKQKSIFSTVNVLSQQAGLTKSLMIFTQKNCYNMSLMTGKIQLQSTSFSTQNYIFSLLKLHLNDDIHKYKGVQKIQAPFKVIQKQLTHFNNSKDQINRKQIAQKVGSSQILLVNKFQVWYCVRNHKQKTINPVSVYTLINNDFLEFRNNLSVDQLEQPQFIRLFSQKLPIVQVKYLNNNSIIVLFQKQITVLQIGQNGSLIVKQEILFSKITKQNSSQNINQKLNISQGQNEYSSIKIIELLDKCSGIDLFLKDAQGRLYLLVYDSKTALYSIKFDRNLQEDIVSIIRTNSWEQSKISVPLLKNNQRTSIMSQSQEIIVKKDSQLIIRDLLTGKQKSQYV